MLFRAKLKQAIPACPAVLFLSGYGSFLCYYAHFLYILFPSFRILTAAFTSRSIRFPHSHRYIRSDNASSFFLCPHTLHILLDAKYLSTFIRYFPRSSIILQICVILGHSCFPSGRRQTPTWMVLIFSLTSLSIFSRIPLSSMGSIGLTPLHSLQVIIAARQVSSG